MLARKIFTLILLLGILAIASGVNAQGTPGTTSPAGSKTFTERVDDFTSKFLGGILPSGSDKRDSNDNKDGTQASKQSSRPTSGRYEYSGDPDTQSGSIIRPSTQDQQPWGDSSSRAIRVYRSDNASPTTQSADNRLGRRYFESKKVQDTGDTPENTQFTPIKPTRQSPPVSQNKNPEGNVELSDQEAQSAAPLYERFSQFRRSAFDHPKSDSPDGSARKAVVTGPATSATVMGSSPAPIFSTVKDEPPSQKDSPSAIADSSTALGDATEPTKLKPSATRPAGKPTLAKRPSAAVMDQPFVAERPSPATRDVGVIVPDGPSISKSPAVKDTGREASRVFGGGEVQAAPENSMLFARKGPVLSVETHGPRKITVGKESAYEVKIINAGDVAAEDLIVFVNLPDWAEVVGNETSTGSTQIGPAQMAAPFQWKVGRLEARSAERITLRIVPRQSRPFDLAVRWDFKPAASQTMIEVQEPKLEMQLDGPREVFYGKKETYRLKMMNTGTGNAEGVAIKFVPVGAGDNVQAVYDLGILAAGEDKVIEVELTARQSGTLEIQVEAKGDAGIHAQLSEKVLVRRAALELAVEGPKLQFVGATATYVVRVNNPGNAPAKNVNLVATLPPGLKYLGGIEGGRSEGGKLRWVAESIGPETVQTFAIKCVSNAGGVSRLEVAASAEDDLAASAVATTQIESAANLALDAKDPGGPVPVGEEAIYEVRVRNRGTKDAEGVEVVCYFSRGIEPIGAEGAVNRIAPGQVVFLPVPTLAPGAEINLKIRARAEQPGNHIFRAEMHCKALGSRLVSEEATLYYQDALAIPQNLQARPPLERNIH
jgi:uncharacterized repeat protein (TIGR01451 family)